MCYTNFSKKEVMNLVECIDKQQLLMWLKENWPGNWTGSDVAIQRQQDWREFYDTVKDFPSVDPGESEEDVYTYAEICIDSYFDSQWHDLIVGGSVQCCICNYPFPAHSNAIEVNKNGDDTRKWISEDKIFELEDEVKRDLKKKSIPWSFCPGCGRKIKGYC